MENGMLPSRQTGLYSSTRLPGREHLHYPALSDRLILLQLFHNFCLSNTASDLIQ